MNIQQTIHQFLSLDDNERKKYLEIEGDKFIADMLSHIGNPNAELREQYIYRTFHELLSYNLLNKQQLLYLFNNAMNEHHLFYKLGEKETDSVFTRSFSALLLADLLAVDAKQLILPENELENFFEKIPPFLSGEKDTRVFIAEKGWAHSIAYGADLIVLAIQHPVFDMRLAPKILQSLKETLWKGYAYHNDEEERFIRILEILIEKGLPEELLIEWTEQLFDKLKLYLMQQGYSDIFFKSRTCTLNLMKTFYFTLKFKNSMPTLQGVIYVQIAKWLQLS